jgi:dCMP deaminase
MNNKNEWDLEFLSLAKRISKRSKDPSTKVGAVITNGKRIVSTGYNGLPQKMADTKNRLDNRELKYKIIIHGEINAILFAQRDLTNHTLYTIPFMPCSNCASIVIQAGITRVVSLLNNNERWKDAFLLTEESFQESGVELVLYTEEDLNNYESGI